MSKRKIKVPVFVVFIGGLLGGIVGLVGGLLCLPCFCCSFVEVDDEDDV